MLSISIVSHGQFHLVKNLLDDLAQVIDTIDIEVLLTINIPETLPEHFSCHPFPVKLINNTTPKGFGANHNAAFQKATYPFFCVLNPDIRLMDNPFPPLIKALEDKNIAVAAPAIIDEHHILQDSARKFLTITELLKRLIPKHWTISNTSKKNTENPDWVAGMFMLFRRDVFEEIQGFNEAYFMYCEDMELCARLKQKNYHVYYNADIKVIHTAQRQSHKNIRHFIWHIQSLLRYFWRYYFCR